MLINKYKLLMCFFILSSFSIQSQEVDDVSSATTTLFTRFLKHSYEFGVEKAIMRSDLEIVLKSIPSVFRKNYPFGHPFFNEKGKVTKGFNRTIHQGYKILSELDKRVVSTGKGEVIQIGNISDKFGKFVVIKHDHNFYSVYADLDNIIVNEGQIVGFRDNIATIDTNITYIILHTKNWDYELNQDFLNRCSINPYEFINN